MLSPYSPKPLNKIFLKLSSRSILRLCVAITSCKRLEKFHALIFHETWKTSFWTHFGLIWSKHPKIIFFQKIQLPHSLSNLIENVRKLLQAVLEKNSRQMDKQIEGISQGLHGRFQRVNKTVNWSEPCQTLSRAFDTSCGIAWVAPSMLKSPSSSISSNC